MLEEVKSLYPSLVYRLFHAGVFDNAENRNRPIHIKVYEIDSNLREHCAAYDYESVMDVPFDLLRMSCYKEPSLDCGEYCLCGMPAGIDGNFALKYKEEQSPFTLRSVLEQSQLPTIGIIVDLLPDDKMIVLFPTEDYSIETLPRNVFGTTYKGNVYFHSIAEFTDYAAKRSKK